MDSIRKAHDDKILQGLDEKIRYPFDFTVWGTPTNPVVAKIFDESDAFADVSSSCLTGSPIITDNEIKSPFVKSLVRGHVYRLVISALIGENTQSAYIQIVGEV